MATVKEVYEIMDRFCPFRTQMDFDNAGFLVGRGEMKVSKILVSLDITLPVVREAERLGANLIISHHPVIFHPARRVTDQDPVGEILLELTEKRIAAICAHTNLDVAVGGVNDALAQTLGLKEVRVFLPQREPDSQGRPFGLGRVGVVDPCTASEFAARVRERLHTSGIRCVDSGREVRKVAVGGGACGDCLEDAVRQECDLFVTADVKYNVFLDAAAMNISLIDAGHYATETVVVPCLTEMLAKALPDVEILPTKVPKEVYFGL